MPPRATLGGIPLVGRVSWSQTTGTSAPAQTFMLHDSQWSRMEALLGKSVTLKIASDTAPTLTWEKLIPIREVVTNKPYIRGVLVSDVRYWWMRQVVVRSYNIPRKNGNRMLVAGSLIELAIPYDEYAYAYASMRATGWTRRKWYAREVIEDVLADIAEKCDHPYEIRGLGIANTPDLTVENVNLFESAEVALARVLRLIPQSLVTVDKTGKAIVFDGTDRAATEQMMEHAGPPTEVGQIDRKIDLAAVRPKKIHVYFERDVELRFDSEEETEYDPGGVSVPADQNDDAPVAWNVLPLPDPYTKIGGDNGEYVAQGTWVQINKAVHAWNDELGDLGKVNVPALTMANIRKHWFRLESLYAPLGKVTASGAEAYWPARVAAIRYHYRRTYQINFTWMQHIRDLKAIRIGIGDPVSGTRALSQVWGQYCIEPSDKAYAQAGLANDPELRFAWLNVDDYPGFFGDVWTKSASPAKVEILDRDLGIFHVDYVSDRFGMRAQIHPSMMKVDGSGKHATPSIEMRDQLVDVMTINGKCGAAAKTWLDEDHRLAIILTARPFAPNSSDRCYVWDVDPDDIKDSVSKHFQVAGGRGPDWHIVVPPSLCTAWYGITSSVEARHSAPYLFGFAHGKWSHHSGYHVINAGSDPGPPLIPAMANAAAAAQWAAFVSQREGTRSVHLQPSAEMAGSIEGIQHTLGADGRLITSISMPAARRPMDAMALIPNLQRPYIIGTIVEFPA